MELHDIPRSYVARLNQSGKEISQASIAELISCLTACYNATKPAGLAAYGGDEDMLMVEWFPRFKQPGMDVLLVRQLITAQGSIYQMQIRRSYADVPPGLKLPGSSDWQTAAHALRSATSALVSYLENADPLETRILMEQMS